MKVKITKGGAWYLRLKDKEFNVVVDDKLNYKLIGQDLYITKTDCKVIEESAFTAHRKEPHDKPYTMDEAVEVIPESTPVITTPEKYRAFRKRLLDDACKLNDEKNKDYSKGNPDFLAHFKEQGEDFDIVPEKVIGMLMKKQSDAVYNYVKTGGQSESEPIRERIKDVINYSVMLLALIEEKNNI